MLKSARSGRLWLFGGGLPAAIPGPERFVTKGEDFPCHLLVPTCNHWMWAARSTP